ncbi:hypothetical protein PI124_g15401, partial [Phytophthora idaei]
MIFFDLHSKYVIYANSKKTSTQFVFSETKMQPYFNMEPSAGAPPYCVTPSTFYRRFFDRCERSLHHTNRSQFLRDEEHHRKWFVANSSHVRECLAELLGTF